MSARFFLFPVSLLPGLALAAETPPDLASSVGQMLFGLGAVLAMLFGVLWLLKRIGLNRGAAAGGPRVLGATAVGARERVVMVQVADRVLVLGVAPGRVNALSEFDASELPRSEPAGTDSNGGRAGEFAARLNRLLERKQ